MDVSDEEKAAAAAPKAAVVHDDGPSLALLEQAFDSLVDNDDDDGDDARPSLRRSPLAVRAASEDEDGSCHLPKSMLEGGRIRIDDDVFASAASVRESAAGGSNCAANFVESVSSRDGGSSIPANTGDRDTHSAGSISQAAGMSSDNDDDNHDEDVRKAMKMAELMQSHPHLSPEELSKRASELVGNSQRKLLPPKKTLLEEASLGLSKQGQGLMAALKETGTTLLQTVPMTEDGLAGFSASAPERPHVLAGLKNVQESFRQQQHKVKKNFGLMKEGAVEATKGQAQLDACDVSGAVETSLGTPSSPGDIPAIGSTDFGYVASPRSTSLSSVAADGSSDMNDASATSIGTTTPQSDQLDEGELLNVTPSIVKPSIRKPLDEVENEAVPDLPGLDIKCNSMPVSVERSKSAPVSPSKIPQQAPKQSTVTSTTFATSSVPTQPPALAKLFVAKDSQQGISLDESGATLSSLVWKRRSGLGKLQKNAWERRRMMLRGSVICYFSGEEDEKNDKCMLSKQGSEEGLETISADKPANWWEQATLNIQKQAAELTQQVAQEIAKGANLPGAQPADPNAPRGVLDIVKERATFSASQGHSGAPSPFCISMSVSGNGGRNEVKWKIALATRSEQMRWLAALTDVVVKYSAHEYNEGLKMAENEAQNGGIVRVGEDGPAQADLYRQGGKVATVGVGALLQAPSAASLYSPPPNGIDKYWTLDEYSIHGCAIGGSEDVGDRHAQGEEEEEDKDKADSETSTNSEALGGTENVVNTENCLPPWLDMFRPSIRLGKDWCLQGDPLYFALILLNWAILYARRSSTSIDKFWFAIVAVNCIVWLSLKKVEGAGTSLESSIVEKQKFKKKEKRKELAWTDKAKVKAKVTPSVKPQAGSTLIRVVHADDKPINRNGHRFCGFRVLPSSEFKVRSHGYLSTKKKVPCPGELYSLAAMDVFESDLQYRDIAKRVVLPSVKFKDDGDKAWHSPDIFVVSIALPTEPPSLRRATDDGRGFTIVMYFTMKQSTREILRKITSSEGLEEVDPPVGDIQKSLTNGVKLFEEWCRRAPSDPSFQARFKFIPLGNNLTEIGMPGWIGSYNGKPCLIKRAGVTGFLYEHPEVNAMAFEISLHPFPYLAKQATAYMADNYFKKMVASFAFVIEGRDNKELPEVLIGQGSQLCYPDPAIAINARDLFTGNSPNAFDRDGVATDTNFAINPAAAATQDEIVRPNPLNPADTINI